VTDSQISATRPSINIERGIPVQDGRSGANKRRTKYPWRDLEVGDSFLATGVTQNAMATTGRYHAQKTGWTFRCATVSGGVRVWRIA